jgi:hypothetical protein
MQMRRIARTSCSRPGKPPNLQDAAGKEFGDVGEGDVVVFQPLGDEKFKFIARVAPPAKWSEWAK